MAFANSDISDIAATTLNARSGKISDNVTKNNKVLARLAAKGKIRPLSGGNQIYEELSFQENGNFTWMSGYDLIPVAAQDVISAAVFNWKQATVAVTISGLEMMQNSGEEAIIDLLEGRIAVAEATMKNQISAAIYSDGTGSGGKEITGLQAAVSTTPTTGTYGGIPRETWAFWRNKAKQDASYTSSTIYGDFLDLWVQLVRGSDAPDLILADSNVYSAYEQSLQAQQRFTSVSEAQGGFRSLKFHTADVVLDGGIGGYCPTDTAFFLNTDYISWRPHKSRNMVALNPERRAPVNQDATVSILAFMGNLTCRGAQFQGVFYK